MVCRRDLCVNSGLWFQLFSVVTYQGYVTEEHAMIKRTLAKNALHAAAMIGRLAACAGQ